MYNRHKKRNVASAVVILCCGMILSCKKEIKPINLIEPQRTIDSTAMKAYKANLSSRYVSMGYIYGWGTSDASILMHTPDSLDIIVVRDGYDNISHTQVDDLNNVRSKKATKVLLGFDFNTNVISVSDLADTITNRQSRTQQELAASGATTTQIASALTKVKTDAESWAKALAIYQYNSLMLKANDLIPKYNFDGISILLPVTSGYLQDAVNVFFQNLSPDYGIGKKNILVIENPDTLYNNYLKNANWLVYNKQTPNYYLSYISDNASLFPSTRYLPTADYTNTTDADGFVDSQTFGPNGIFPRTMDIVNWYASNKGGAALYHIEKDYTNITGNMTYTSLRQFIQALQLSKK
ncbi:MULTISPECIES: glycoside hydrolase family 18 [Chitinophagaceae]